MEAVTTVTSVTRKRVYAISNIEEVMTVIMQLSSTRHTGLIQVNMGQGAIRNLVAEDYANVE